jgi:hypothetical protein
MNRLRNYAALTFACWLLVACSTINLGVPKSFNASLQDGYTAITAIVNTAGTLYAAGKLSDADKANVVSVATEAKNGLDIARQIHTTDPTAGADKLTATIAGLTALQNYLVSRSST